MTPQEFKRVKIGDHVRAARNTQVENRLDEGHVEGLTATRIQINGEWWHFSEVENTLPYNLREGDEIHLTNGEVWHVTITHDTDVATQKQYPYLRLLNEKPNFLAWVDVRDHAKGWIDDALKDGATIVKK